MGVDICILSSQMLGLVVFMSNMKHLVTYVMIYQLFTQFVMLQENVLVMQETRESRNSYCHPAKTCSKESFHLTRSKLFKVHIALQHKYTLEHRCIRLHT